MSGFYLLCYVSRGDRTRTGDPLVPNQVRYQLRYAPKAVAKVQQSRDTAKFSGIKICLER